MNASPCKNPARLDAIRSPFDDGRAEPCDQNGRPLHAGADETLGKLQMIDALVALDAALRGMPNTWEELLERAPAAGAGLGAGFVKTHFAEARESALRVLQAAEDRRRAQTRDKAATREDGARAAMAFDPGYSVAEEAAALHARLLNCALCMFAAGVLACALIWAATETLL